ncbi:MAG: ORF6N domain-containing protein [Gammaproteobacteria bacterium]|nr:MAG: ORF6N domain-containing protein [Gammaproteobacteria bacterium]
MTGVNLLSQESIGSKILWLRQEKVLLGADLAELYGVETRVLNQAVKRNIERFPADFMFRLTGKEVELLVSQNVIPHPGRLGGALPYAFTEQGVAMLSGVLKSPRAVAVNIEIMRAFVQLRGMLASNAALSRKLAALERRYDEQFKIVFDAIRQMMAPPEPKKRRIGFVRDD